MLGNLQVGQMGFGMMPARIPVKLVNRVGTALLIGEVLMLDMENVAYGTSADEAGVFGNGITPGVAGTGGAALIGLNWPMACVISGQGSRAGDVVDLLAQGITTVRTVNTLGLGAVKGLLMVYLTATGGRNPDTSNAVLAATTRPMGYQLTAHTVAVGVENITGFFQGLQSR